MNRRAQGAVDQTKGSAVIKTASVTRGICRAFHHMGYAVLREFKLGNGRRADVAALNDKGKLIFVEVKSTPSDFYADDKWLEYVPYCDAFSFAVPEDFPLKILPSDVGIMVADSYEAAIVRPAAEHPLHASRRKALILRFAIAAGQRLNGQLDPDGR